MWWGWCDCELAPHVLPKPTLKISAAPCPVLRAPSRLRHPVPIDIAKSAEGLRHNVLAARDSTQLLLGQGPCR